MIQKLMFVNPINLEYDNLEINIPDLDYFNWKRSIDYKNDNDIINILEDMIKTLDCTKVYNNMRICTTTFPIYKINVANYYRYLIKLNNYILYNVYLDKLLKRHIDNIIFEHENPYYIVNDKKSKKNTVPNKFFRGISRDLFTNELHYIYTNPKTNERIISANPNLLEELNAPKKKEKTKTKTKINKSKIKSFIKFETGVPLSAMTFNFKKK